jgi:hypothetical protein
LVKIKTHILCSKTFSENLAVYEWKNMAELNRPQMGIEYGAYATHAG